MDGAASVLFSHPNNGARQNSFFLTKTVHFVRILLPSVNIRVWLVNLWRLFVRAGFQIQKNILVSASVQNIVYFFGEQDYCIAR